MNSDFHAGFEKTAFVGAVVKTMGKGIWGLGKKLTTSVSPKGVRTINPLKAVGTAFLGAEAGSVINKTNKTVKNVSGAMPSMKGSSFFKMR